MRSTAKFIAIIIPLMVAACGGHGGATSPDAVAAPATLRLVAERTGAAIAGAMVYLPELNKSPLTLGQTGASGGVALVGVEAGATIEIVAPGFRGPTYAIVNAGDNVIRLWEEDAKLPREFVDELVYGVNQGTTKHLERPTASVLTVNPVGDMLTNDRVRQALPAAVKELNKKTTANLALGKGATFVINDSGTVEGEYPITLKLTPGEPGNPGELTYSNPSPDGTLNSCEIHLEGIDGFWGPWLQRVLTHSLMHTLGFVHAPGFPGIMGDQDNPRNLPLTLGAFEGEVIRKIFWREPGNTLIDTAYGVPTALVAASDRQFTGGHSNVVCALDTPAPQ